MRNKDSIPRRDGELRRWATGFVAKLAADPAVYGVSAGDVAECEAALSQFCTALARASDFSTGGPLATYQKNTARKALVAMIRRLARLARASDASSEALFSAGLLRHSPMDPPPTPPAVPLRAPEMKVALGANKRLRVTVRQFDSFSNARPPNTAGAMIYASFADQPPSDEREWFLLATTTRPTTTVGFKASDPPFTPVWLSACWISPTLRRGPFSEPIQSYVPPGLSVEFTSLRRAA